MGMTIKKKTKSKQKSLVSKMIGNNKICNTENVRLEGLVSDLSKVRDDMCVTIQRQNDELTVKNGQLKSGKAKQARSKKQMRIHNIENVRLEGLVSDLSKVRVDMGGTIQHQTDELKIKNGQLRNGKVKQAESKEEIHIHTIAMEATVDGIFIIDTLRPNFPVIYANKSFQEMIGYDKKGIIGKDYFTLYGVGTDYRIIDEIKQTIKQGKAFHGEMFNFRKSGRKYLDMLRLSPVFDNKSKITNYVGIQTDVTSRREKELKIEE